VISSFKVAFFLIIFVVFLIKKFFSFMQRENSAVKPIVLLFDKNLL